MARMAAQSAYGYGVEIRNLPEVEAALKGFEKKLPAAVKGAVNDTARHARKLMVSSAKKRYALSSTGRAHVSDLAQNKKATVSDTRASLYIKSMRNDLSYFDVRPRAVVTGARVFSDSPKHFKGRVLKSSSAKPLTGDGKTGKGFLLEFSSGHIGAVQRQLGVATDSRYLRTANGKARWETKKSGVVEKLRTMTSPSITELHGRVWRDVAPAVQDYLDRRVLERARDLAAREATKANG